MTRTSKALKRLGVVGVAAVTVGGFIALPVGTASANHTGQATSVDVSPNADTATVGTCNLFRIDAYGNDTNAGTADASERKAENTVIDVTLSEEDTNGVLPGGTSDTADPDFCTAPTANPNAADAAATGAGAGTAGGTSGSTTPASGANATDSGATGQSTDRAEFTTNANGVVYFGVISNEAGNVNINVFIDRDSDNVDDPEDPSDAAVKTFVAGGTENANCVDANPENDTNVVGETHTITVRVTDNGPGANVPDSGAGACAGNTVPGVTPVATITSSSTASGAITPTPTATFTCSATNNDGVSTCTYSSSQARTDNIRVHVNQNQDAGGTGYNAATEPSDTVTKAWTAAPTGLQVALSCQAEAYETTPALGSPAEGNALPAGVTEDQANGSCANVIPNGDRVFTATVSNNPSTGTNVTGNVEVRFTVTGGSGDETVTGNSGTNQCTTANNANTTAQSCDVLVNDPTPVSGEVLTITATVAGTQASDTGTLRFFGNPATARTIVLTPEAGNAAAGGVITYTATVRDAAGNPVAGVTVTFTESAPGTFRTTATPTTNAQGQATVELAAAAAETGSGTVTATIDSATTDCELAANTPNQGNPAGSCTDTSTATFGGSPSPTTTSTGTPTGTPTTPAECTGATGVTISVNVQRITSGNAPTLSGVVTNAAGQPVSGCTITLLAKNYIQTTYSGVQTTAPIVTDDSGRWVVVVRPERQTAYVARVNQGGAQSRSLVIFVSARVNLNRPAAGQVLPRSFCFTGDLDPNAPDFRGAAVGLAKVGRDAAGRPTFAVIGQTVTRNDANATFTVCPRSGQLADGVYVIFTSARNGLLKGSVSQTVNTA